jgi:hypothetical protein
MTAPGFVVSDIPIPPFPLSFGFREKPETPRLCGARGFERNLPFE